MRKTKKVPDWMFAYVAAMLMITVWIAVNDHKSEASVCVPENTAEAGQIIAEETDPAEQTIENTVEAAEGLKRGKLGATEDELQETKETVEEETVYLPVERKPERETELAAVEEDRTGAEPSEMETTAAISEEVSDPAEEVTPLYAVDGEVMDEDLQRFLWEELKIEDIEWWMPYAMLTAYQESGFDIYDITNGRDYGIYQFYIEDWDEKCARYGYPGADVFNPYVQIVVYVKQTANRLKNLGCSIEDTISRHMMSDWCGYNAKYVSDVLGHTIEQIR